MLLERLYDPTLAQATYLVGCERTGEALVVDPNRDLDRTVAAAAAAGVRITQVAETHIHADFASGARALAERVGAQLLLSDEGGDGWRYGFAADAGARLVRDGDRITVGDVRLDVMHTPGHTPEHLAFVVTDAAAASVPAGALTGDFIFVADVGRPDLLETAAGVAGTMDASARALFRSLQRFKALPDFLQLWPGHGAGSACGKALGALASSTLGYERLANWALLEPDESRFVAAVLAGQPEPPRYFARMKVLNRDAPPRTGLPGAPPALADDALAGALDGGALVIDTRPPAAFAAAHAPGAINVPLGRAFATWVGSIADGDAPLYLVVDDACPGCAREAARALALIGIDAVQGAFGAGALEAWRARTGRPLGTVAGISVDDAARAASTGAPLVLDVRGRAEWAAGHLAGAVNVPVGELWRRTHELPRDRPIVVHCQGGTRSAIAASLLQRAGFTHVQNMAAGFAGWSRAGLPSQRDDA